MATANGSPSSLAVVGLLSGTALLLMSGTMVVLAPSAYTPEQAIEAVQGGVRRLQTFNVLTTTAPSSFDSSDSSSSGSSLEPSKSLESDSMKSGGTFWESSGATGGVSAGYSLTSLAIMLCFAFCYYEKVVVPIVGPEGQGTLEKRMGGRWRGKDDFDNGICSCTSDMWVCIHGFCCPLVRMAHTNAVSGVCGFWESALCWCCCSFWSAGLGPCCLMVWWRMQLKKIMGLEDHILNDFCITLFCPMLSICQQGIAVDTAMGYEVVGCCDLEWGSPMAQLDARY